MPHLWKHLRGSLASKRHRQRQRGRNASETTGVVPLTHVRTHCPARVVRVHCEPGSQIERLCEMGLTTGCHLQVLRRRTNTDPVIIQLGDSRLCLGSEVARHVWVQQTAS